MRRVTKQWPNWPQIVLFAMLIQVWIFLPNASSLNHQYQVSVNQKLHPRLVRSTWNAKQRDFSSYSDVHLPNLKPSEVDVKYEVQIATSQYPANKHNVNRFGFKRQLHSRQLHPNRLFEPTNLPPMTDSSLIETNQNQNDFQPETEVDEEAKHVEQQEASTKISIIKDNEPSTMNTNGEDQQTTTTEHVEVNKQEDGASTKMPDLEVFPCRTSRDVIYYSLDEYAQDTCALCFKYMIKESFRKEYTQYHNPSTQKTYEILPFLYYLAQNERIATLFNPIEMYEKKQLITYSISIDRLRLDDPENDPFLRVFNSDFYRVRNQNKRFSLYFFFFFLIHTCCFANRIRL